MRPPAWRTVLAYSAATLVCLGLIAFFFLSILTVWGLVAAPFVRLRASWPIHLGAFLLATWLTAHFYRHHLSTLFTPNS